MPASDPHQNCALRYAGAPVSSARLVVLALHGRYGAPGDILKYAAQVGVADVAWIAPEAVDRSWWGHSFLAPLSDNEPGLSSALNRLSAIIEGLGQDGIGPEQICLFGFSQGGCLILEHTARHPRPFHGVFAMSGGLLGSAEAGGAPRAELLDHVPKRFDYAGDLSALPIHISCHTEDPVIPQARVTHSAAVLRAMGAAVALDLCPGKMHGALPSDTQKLAQWLGRDLG